MNITSTAARFTATWAVEILIDPGSVPDRPVPYSRTGAVYRPGRITLKFTTAVRHPDPSALKLTSLTAGHGPLSTARDSIRLDSAHAYGPRLKANGEPGQHAVNERFYGQDEPPEWLRELVTRTREQLS